MAPQMTARHQASASDSEDDLVASDEIHNLSPNNAHGNSGHGMKMPPKTKSTAKRAAAAKTTTGTKRKAAPSQTRQALKDRTNIHNASDNEEDGEDIGKPKTKRAKTAATVKKTVSARAASDPAEEARGLPSLQPIASSGPKRGRSKKPAATLGVIPETQQAPEDDQGIEQSIEIDEDSTNVANAPTPPRAHIFAQRQRSTSVQPLQPRTSAHSVSAQLGYPSQRERSGSVSDNARERRGGDPELRRNLNDITKEHQNLRLKYESLQEVGQDSAKANFEKLKRASDNKAKDANELIANLKRELAELRKGTGSNSAELEGLQKQTNNLKTSNNKLSAENKDLKESLQTSQNEIKSLEAKVVAARQQMSAMSTQENATSKVPGSASKGLNRALAGSNATDAQKEAKMKENLYSDLTGLIIRGVKRKEGEDEYDCIQTGRNGTLHFHLSIANDSNASNPKTPTGLSYEEAEFAYEPLLDEGRDRELLHILPDYLTEEICFPRNHAVKFYSRVVDSMTKRIVVEE